MVKLNHQDKVFYFTFGFSKSLNEFDISLLPIVIPANKTVIFFSDQNKTRKNLWIHPKAHADSQWKHCKSVLQTLEEIHAAEEEKLKILNNFVNYNIHETISGANSYLSAISIVYKLFIKPKNKIIYAQHQYLL